jgi:hypothetical protein
MGLYETLPYEVVKKECPIEIRKYNDFLLASTKTVLNQRYDSGFSNVFNYISGRNKNKEKISMTTPVVSYEENQQLVTGFYVPSKYQKDTVPQPSDPNVFIDDYETALYGVIRFKGSWKEAHLKEKETELRAYLKKHQFNIESQRLLFRYNPPFVPSVFRRNEIAFKVSESK